MTEQKFIVISDKLEIKASTETGKGDSFEGVLSTSTVDSYNDIVTKACMDNMLEQIRNSKKTMGSFEHVGRSKDIPITSSDDFIPVSRLTGAEMSSKGLTIKGELNPYHPKYETYKNLIAGGWMDGLSIEFKPLEFVPKEKSGGTRILNKVLFAGYGHTARPANNDCTLSDFFMKSVEMENTNAVEDELKAQITAMEEHRKKMSASESEYYAVPELHKLPIFDADHVRNAMARFNQTEGMSPEQRKTAHTKIMSAAKKFGIEVGQFKEVKGGSMDMENKPETAPTTAPTAPAAETKTQTDEITEIKKDLSDMKKAHEEFKAFMASDAEFKTAFKATLSAMKPDMKNAPNGERPEDTKPPEVDLSIKSQVERAYGKAQ